MSGAQVAIVGAEPVGPLAAFALGRLGRASGGNHALDPVGGKRAALHPATPNPHIPGHAAATGAGLIEAPPGRAAPCGPEFRLVRHGLALGSRDAATCPGSPATMTTRPPGLFTIGDIARHPGRRTLIPTGAAEAASAARAHLHPGRDFRAEHSTTRGRPGAAEPKPSHV